MRENKFTAGPWELFGYTDEDIEIDIVHDYKYVNGKHQADWIANLQEENVKGGFSVMEANAHLISAAPELLQSLEMIMVGVDYQHTDIHPDIRSFVNASIAKAYGEKT